MRRLPSRHPPRCPPPPSLPPPLLCSAWALYFEYESEFSGWQALYAAAVQALQAAEAEDPAGGGTEDARSRLGALALQTLPLLGAMVDFVGQRSLDCLVGWGEGGAAAALAAAAKAGAPAEVVVVVGPDAGADTAPEVQQGAAFPAYASPEEQQAEAEALQAALGAAAEALPKAEQRQLAAKADLACDDMPGLVTGAIPTRTPAGVPRCGLHGRERPHSSCPLLSSAPPYTPIRRSPPSRFTVCSGCAVLQPRGAGGGGPAAVGRAQGRSPTGGQPARRRGAAGGESASCCRARGGLPALRALRAGRQGPDTSSGHADARPGCHQG